MKYSFVLPCLNEENSLPGVISEIKEVINKYNLDAEILISDNGSTDRSIEISKENGCRVCNCEEKGYGNALICATKNATGDYLFMLDSDGSYSLQNLNLFLDKINDGYEFVSGNRYKGGIEKGAMSLSHKIGVKGLSMFGNMFFHTPIKDWHCGLRGYKRELFKNINWISSGMEYASEMIIRAKKREMKMCEVPTILRPDTRGRKPHLRTIRDGLRHVNLITKMFIKGEK